MNQEIEKMELAVGRKLQNIFNTGSIFKQYEEDGTVTTTQSALKPLSQIIVD